MPTRPGNRKRLIPIITSGAIGDIRFRFVSGERSSSQITRIGSSMVWASCMKSTSKVEYPKTITRTFGSIGGVATFQVAQSLKFPEPCESDIAKQIDTRVQIRT